MMKDMYSNLVGSSVSTIMSAISSAEALGRVGQLRHALSAENLKVLLISRLE